MKKLILLIFLGACNVSNSSKEENEPHVIIEDTKIEIVSDEYGNQYLKQIVDGFIIYIPFPFETEEEPQSQTFQIKQ